MISCIKKLDRSLKIALTTTKQILPVLIMKKKLQTDFIVFVLLFLAPLVLFSQATTFNHSGVMESYTVPAGVTKINVTAFGAQGAAGDPLFLGGKGAKMSGDFNVIPGSVLIIAVGGQGLGQSSNGNGGGGGGSFVVLQDPASTVTIAAGPFAGKKVSPLVIAGGGGGTRAAVSQNGNPGVITLLGTTGSLSNVTGGGMPNKVAAGAGGQMLAGSWGSAGGGFLGNGADDSGYGIGGKAFINGALGGNGPSGNAFGGFGGGGQGNGGNGGGGGGGYTGGDGGRVAGGGGSYNTGTNQVNESGVQSGNGQVIVTVLCDQLKISPVATTVCAGSTITLNATSLNSGTVTWNNGVANNVPFTIFTTTTFTASSSTSKDCETQITITVSAPKAKTNVNSNVSCNGGSNGAAAVEAYDGASPYTYLWSNGATTPAITGLTAGTYTVTVTDANGCTAKTTAVVTQPTALAASTSQTNISCNGGSNGAASVTVSGGTPGYTYSWSPYGGTGATATGLSAGVYTVTITDAKGCTLTKIFTVTQFTGLVASTSQTNITCNGGSNGSASVNATGGAGSYTYLWSPSGGTSATATGLKAGVYSVLLTDANSCSLSKTFTITQPTALAATTAQTNLACNGGSNGSASVNVTGGVGGYTYLWSPSGGTAASATGLTAGNYTVLVTDANSCTLTKTFTITQPTALVASVSSQTNVSCNGGSNGSATVRATGGTGSYTYSWLPSGGTAATATGLSAGSYNVTVTDVNGCTATQTFIITQPTALIASAASQINVSCFNGSNGSATVSTTGGTGTYSYSWAPRGGTSATATGLSAGNYTVTVSDVNGCSTTKLFTVTQPSVITASVTELTNVACNGSATGSATVAASGGTGTYTYAWLPRGGTAATATGLSAGAYNVLITDANGCTFTQPVTITQPTALVVTPLQTNVSCNGLSNGSATVNTTGGTGAYTYAWLPSGGTAATATGLSAGTYTATVTDANGCTVTQSFTITQPAALVASAATQKNVSCFEGSNGSATVSVTGGTGPYTYTWLPSGGTAATATGLSAGTYTVNVSDANGCTTTQSFTITQPTILEATASITATATCVESTDGSATVLATGGTSPYTYLWDNGETTATATSLSVANHTVTVTDVNGCATTAAVMIDFKDTIAPVPVVATLIDIKAECIITAADVVVPTATDNCAGNVITTHDAVFPITLQGTTVVTWTYTDVNGNITKQTQNVIIDDVTAPVVNMPALPAITMQCAVLSTDIPVPTATDNCVGTIIATTKDALLYTDLGEHTITWTYDDGNGNTTTQTQNVTVTQSAISAVTFTDKTFVYNTAAQGITVENLPAGAAVKYSVSPKTGFDNQAVNAGIYTVTAVVTPAANAPNCEPITLTAIITINKAEQQIVFSPLPLKHLETDADFQLTATSTSGLPVYYTFSYTAPDAPATVTAEGWVDMLTSGIVQITAHQDGNDNYLPAVTVTQPLQINSNDSTIHNININGTDYANPTESIYYLMECDDTATSVAVLIKTEANATLDAGHEFVINTPRPGIYEQTVTVTSQDGTTTRKYTIVVEKMFQFFDIVIQKFDNVLLANNNSQNNGGYSFTAYEWYKNGVVVSKKQYLSEGPTNNDLLDPNAEYYVKLTTVEGDVLQTCTTNIVLEHNYRLSVTPNPAKAGKEIIVTVDFPAQEIDNMQIDVYDLSGRKVYGTRSSQRVTAIQLPGTIQASTYLVMCTTPNHQKTFKIIVSE
jgi:hypothetical protein